MNFHISAPITLRFSRDDSAKSHEVAAAFVVADDNGDGGGDSNGPNGEAATVVEANDAGVMHMVVEVILRNEAIMSVTHNIDFNLTIEP